jgi:hypothetical protein
MTTGRILLVAGLLAAGGLVAWAALQPPPAPPVAPPKVEGPKAVAPEPAFSDPAQCRACHPAAYEEWSSSMHAKAWTDPEVRGLSEDFKSTECLSCHVPQPIHAAPVGGRVFERSSRYETGVDCLSCHLLPDGGVAAARDVPGAPCRPTKVATLRDAVSCKGCHNQHYLVDEWETLFRAPDPAKGAILREGRPETCIDCHMAPAARPPGPDGAERKGFNHVFHGGHYEEVLRRGMRLEAALEEGNVVARVLAADVGHRAPADSRHRSFNVWMTITTESGVKVRDRAETAEYRMYYRSPPRENTNLRPGETGISRLPLPKGLKGTVLVELVYCMNPVKKEAKEARRVHSVELPFDTTK